MNNLSLKEFQNLERYFEDNPRVKVVGFIYETDDYSIFEKLNGNRDVINSKKLKDSMEKYGFLNIPAVINEKNEVGDGQHRIEVAKKLHLPVKFVVQPGMEIDQTTTINVSQAGWKPKDYLHKGVDLGELDYQRFNALREKFPFADNRSIYVGMGASISGGDVEIKIREGYLVCTEQQYEEACKMLSWLETFCNNLKNTSGAKRNFYTAMMFVRRTQIIDVETLTHRVKTNFDFSEHLGNVEETVNRIEHACNFKVSMQNRVYFVEEFKKAIVLSKSRSAKNIAKKEQ